MQTIPENEVNINILNSLVHLYSAALRPEELEQKVLPQFEKHRVKQDANTFTHLAKLYLKLRDLDKVVELYNTCLESGYQPKYKLVSHYLEAGLRKEDSELIYDGLKKFHELGLVPHQYVLKKLGQLRHMPDNIYVLLKTKFPQYGLLKQRIRQFEKPKFGHDKQERSNVPDMTPDFKKKSRLKKKPVKLMSKKRRNEMNII